MLWPLHAEFRYFWNQFSIDPKLHKCSIWITVQLVYVRTWLESMNYILTQKYMQFGELVWEYSHFEYSMATMLACVVWLSLKNNKYRTRTWSLLLLFNTQRTRLSSAITPLFDSDICQFYVPSSFLFFIFQFADPRSIISVYLILLQTNDSLTNGSSMPWGTWYHIFISNGQFLYLTLVQN